MSDPIGTSPRTNARAMKRAEDDAFSGGVVSILTLIRIHEGGVGTIYEEAVETGDGAKLESFARRNDDVELPFIRKARRINARRGAMP